MTAEQVPTYIYIEKGFTYPHPVLAFITQTNGVNPNNNPVLTFLQETWRSLHEIMGSNLTFTYKTSSSTTLKYIKEHFIGLDGVLGIVYLGYGFDRDKLMFFEQLKKKKNSVVKKAFWKYLQLRHCTVSWHTSDNHCLGWNNHLNLKALRDAGRGTLGKRWGIMV